MNVNFPLEPTSIKKAKVNLRSLMLKLERNIFNMSNNEKYKPLYRHKRDIPNLNRIGTLKILVFY